jgi:hypothetical protein
VRVAPGRTGIALVRAADAARAIEALVALAAGISRLDRGGDVATSLGDPAPEPPRLTWAARGGDAR